MTPDVRPDLLDQDQQLLHAHGKEYEDEVADEGKNEGIRDIEELADSYEYMEEKEDEDGDRVPVNLEAGEGGVQAPLDENTQKDLEFFEEREKVWPRLSSYLIGFPVINSEY